MDDREQAIRQRSYAIWQSEGEPDGRDQEHWDRAAAEKVVLPDLADAAVKRTKRSAKKPTANPAPAPARKPRASKKPG